MSMRSIYTVLYIIIKMPLKLYVVRLIIAYLHTREKTIGNNWSKGGLGSLWFAKTTCGT